jgi:hypothetical protein
MIQSFKVLATLAAYRVVVASSGTANTVGYPDLASKLPMGITKNTVLDTNEAIPVAGPGEIAKLFFADSCVSGSLVGFDTNGQGIAITQGLTSTAISNASGIIGVLIGPKVEAAGTIADVYILPTIVRRT